MAQLYLLSTAVAPLKCMAAVDAQQNATGKKRSRGDFSLPHIASISEDGRENSFPICLTHTGSAY